MSRRLLQIDLLRGISILLVLTHHLNRSRIDQNSWSGRLLNGLSSGGWIGVDLFFVLSGFLVSGLIFQELRATGRFQPWRFLARRGFKIYPTFYLMLALSVPFLAWFGEPVRGAQIWSEALFLQNYLPHLWSHTWSLAIEEQFYLLLTAAVALVAGRRAGMVTIHKFPWLAAGLCAAILAARLISHRVLPFDIKTHYMASHLRMDGLFFGVALSYLACFHKERFRELCARHRRVLLVTGILLMLPCFLKGFGGWHVYSFGLTFLYLGSGALLLSLLGTPNTSPVLRSLPARAIAAIGLHSYSIYVWHVIAKDAVARLPLAPLTERGVYLAVALGLGIAMGKLVEWPLLRMRDRILPPSGATIA
ncbi:MAG: acyltransferase [Oligoflexia bacterium]|nr:acyltransferase [Oligoflexia bacterium]